MVIRGEILPETPQKPFKYEVIDGFLTEQQLGTLKHLYSTLSFKEIRTDLFSFTQSDELADEELLTAFKMKLDAAFAGRVTESNTFYTVFASYYREGDYLLCHDDMIDERLWAFTFYLEDFTGGELILYEPDCTTEHTRVEVRRNRLVLFEVGEASFHEVNCCTAGGRMAITGWINSKERKNTSKQHDRAYSIHRDVQMFDLGIDVCPDGGFISLEFDDIEANEVERRLEGPFTDRRVYSITLDRLYAPSIDGYELISAECLCFEKGCYILCNDKINEKTDGIYDVFIFDVEGPPVEGFLAYVDQSSNIAFKVDAESKQMLMGARENHNIYIGRASRKVFMKHFIYGRTQSEAS